MYGRRPHLSTTDALYHQKILYDISAQTFHPTSLINIDASKCFDKIYPNLENIYLHHIGVHPHLSTVFSNTTKHMSHTIKKSYGIIPQNIISPTDKLFRGLGQGNADTGISWLEK